MQRNNGAGGAPVQLGKLFIGGLSFETTDEKLQKYFSQFGHVTSAVVMRDTLTKRSRGFGFVSFKDNASADKAMECTEHVINDRRVEAKRAVPREHIQPRHAHANTQSSGRPSAPDRGSRGSGKKIFVGGLHYDTSDATLREYFAKFGKVDQVQVMYNRETNKSRGFGFVTFESEETVESVLREKRMHEIDNKSVEVKRAVPKSEAPPPRNSSSVSHQNTGYPSNAQLRRRPPPARPISDQTHDSTGYPSYASKARRAAVKTHAPPLQNPWTTRNHIQNFKQYNSPQHMEQAPQPNYEPRYDNRQMELNMLPTPNEVPAPAPTTAPTSTVTESVETSSGTHVAPSTPDVAVEEPSQPVAVTAPSPEPEAEADNPAASEDATDSIVQPNAAPDTGFDVDSYATLSPSAEGSAAETGEHLTTAPGTASSTRSTRGGGRQFSMFDFAARADGDAGSGDPQLKPKINGSVRMVPNAVPPPAHSDVDLAQQRPPAPAVGPKPMPHPQQQMLMHAFAYPPHSFPPPHPLPYDQQFLPPRQPVGAPVDDDFASNFAHLNITPRMDPPPHMHPMLGHRMHGMGYPSRNFPHGQQPFGYDNVPPELDQHAPRGYPYDAPGSYDMGYGGVPHPPQYSYPPPQHRDANAGPRT